MQLTTANITSVTKITLDEDLANNIWIPAVKQEIRTRCNRSFKGHDAFPTPPSGETNWIREEIPVGDVDGENTVFELAQIPDRRNLKVYVDGQLTYLDEDYQLAGKTLVFYDPPQPGSGKPLTVDYLPKGKSDDEARSEESEYPYDLGVAACWHTVVLANDDPLSSSSGNAGAVKSETAGGRKIEFFASESKETIERRWTNVLRRYRIPAICGVPRIM